MRTIRILQQMMVTTDRIREGGVLAALWLGVLVGAFVLAGGLFGFEFAGPQRSPYAEFLQPTAPHIYPAEPCILAPCDASEIHGEWGCCEMPEQDMESWVVAPDVER